VHGLWSDGFAWDTFKSQFPVGNFPQVKTISYDGAESFTLPRNQDTLKVKIATVISQVRESGIVAAQVDVVGHSMGGLITRWYAGIDANKRWDNFKDGDINRLITLDTPHFGTNLSPLLTTYAPRRSHILAGDKLVLVAFVLKLRRLPCAILLGCTISEIFAALDMPISSAVKSLDPAGYPIKQLKTNPFPYETVSSCEDCELTNADGLEQFFNYLIHDLGGYRGFIDDPLLLGPNNDVIVSVRSQRGDGTTKALYKGLTHLTINGVMDSRDVAQYVGCRLLNRISCPLKIPVASSSSGAAVALRAPLEGRTQVAGSNIDITASLSGLQLNNDYSAGVTSSTYSVEGFSYMIEHKTDWSVKSANPEESIHIVPTDFGPIRLTVVAILSSNKYAIRSWTFTVDAAVTPTLVDIPEDLIKLTKIGAAFQLEPVAYLAEPDKNTLSVSSLAKYSILGTGSEFISVSPSGSVTALKAGTAKVRASYKAFTDTVIIVVGP